MEAVILAAGKGTRMHSKLPKVLHTVGNKPMLAHVIDSAESAGAKKIHIVVYRLRSVARGVRGNSCE